MWSSTNIIELPKNWNVFERKLEIDKGRKIKSQIKQDNELLKDLGITFEQIIKFIQKIEKHYEWHLNNNKIVCDFSKKEKELIDNLDLDIDFDFSKKCVSDAKFVVIFDRFIVKKIVCGHEMCICHNNHNIFIDWLIIDKISLKYILISHYCLRQIIENKYFARVPNKLLTPAKFIGFFGLTQYTDYSCKIDIIEYWKQLSINRPKIKQNNSDYCLEDLKKFLFSDKKEIFDETKYCIEEHQQNIICYNHEKLWIILNDVSLNIPNTIDNKLIKFTIGKTKGIVYCELRIEEVMSEVEQQYVLSNLLSDEHHYKKRRI
jgi:hypothetical protein